MSKKQSKAYRAWEQACFDDYYDFRNHLILDPLYEQFQLWKAGQLHHDDINLAIHKVHKDNQDIYTLFTRSQADLFTIIQFTDWYKDWVKNHPMPVESGAFDDA